MLIHSFRGNGAAAITLNGLAVLATQSTQALLQLDNFVSSVSPSSERTIRSDEGLTLETSAFESL